MFHKFAALPVIDHSVGPDFDGLMEELNRSEEYAQSSHKINDEILEDKICINHSTHLSILSSKNR